MKRSDAKAAEHFLEIGVVHRDFAWRLAVGGSFDESVVKGLEEANLGDGVFLATGERAAVDASPSFKGGLVDKDFEGVNGAAVGGDYVGELAAGDFATLGARTFEEIVLINVTVGGGVRLDAANGIGTRHGRIIGGEEGEVNEAVCREGDSKSGILIAGAALPTTWRTTVIT